MIGDFSKATSDYDATKPFGGIATGMSPQSGLSAPTFNSATNPQPSGSTSSVSGNDMSLTNSYLNALKDQQGATAAAQSLSGYTAPDPSKSALPSFTPEQQKQFQTMFGAMMGIQPNPGAAGATPGLNTVATPTPAAAPKMVAGDNSRFENDPFKVTQNALR